MLRRLTGQRIGADGDGLRGPPVRRHRQLQRRAGLEQPQLVGVDAMPVGALAGLQQEEDRGGGRPPAGQARFGPPGLADTSRLPDAAPARARRSSPPRRPPRLGSQPEQGDQPRPGLAVGDPVDPLGPPVPLEGADDRRGARLVDAGRRAVEAKPRQAGLQGEDARPGLALAQRRARRSRGPRPSSRGRPRPAASTGTARPGPACGRARRRNGRRSGCRRSSSACGCRRPAR